MIQVTHLIGFGAGNSGVPTRIANPNSFTKIGNMIASGGLAGAFDGTVNTNPNGAERVDASNTGYVGLDFSTGKRISKAVARSATNAGYNGSGTPTPSPTLRLYGNNSSPASGTDGTQLAQVTANGVINDVVTLTSSDQNTNYRYVWVYVYGGTSTATSVNELEIWEIAG